MKMKNDFFRKKENMIVIALIGVLLLVIAIPAERKDERKGDNWEKVELTSTTEETKEGEKDYVSALENRMENLLEDVEGVGKTQVMITLKTSEEQIVEKDTPISRSSITENDNTGGSRSTSDVKSQEETVYTVNSNGDKIPYVIKTQEPEIEGITVVAQGGGNPTVQKNISEVIQALFNIEIHRIKVVKMKGI